ncbi:hypothetical protein EfmAA290_30200 (plasmid) [Enterococcus faecium]|nr:hypothetical protein EfmAA290_30200 [Enterococcus faecium]
MDDWKAMSDIIAEGYDNTLGVVRKREKDDSGFTNVDEIDWDNL